MRLGLTSAAFYGRLETEEAAKKLREFPIDTCEIFLETGSEYNREFGYLTREMLGDLHCRAVHAKGTQFESDLFGASKRQRQDAFQTLKGVLDCGQALGAGVYVFHGLPDIRGGLRPKSIPRLCETAGRILELAGERNIRLAWENVAWCVLKRPEDAAYLKEACPELSFVLDIKQAVRAGVDPFAFLPVMGERLIHVHVLDFDQLGRLCLPGEGMFDFNRLRRELDAMDYQGDVILEPYASQTEDEHALHKSICYLRRILLDSPEDSAVSLP
jgi:sugar phosphate isomerase/epimerase